MTIDREYFEIRNDRLHDVENRPDKHHHNFRGLTDCCSIKGIMDLELVDAHSTYASLGINGGVRCDVTSGPCACGAWH